MKKYVITTVVLCLLIIGGSIYYGINKTTEIRSESKQYEQSVDRKIDAIEQRKKEKNEQKEEEIMQNTEERSGQGED